MAAYLNRTISMVTGNGTESTSSLDNTNALTLHNNTAYDNSPLQIFVKAKRKINDIFGEIEEYVKETAQFMHGKSILYTWFIGLYWPKLLIIDH